ncbi:MAG: S8/S53 family peptidase [Chitinophagales bacterium]
MAAEWADSVMGNWIVLSTSLGYSKGFDDKETDHTYEDMDGNTTIITIAADLAARKGMIVVNSAGNEGDDSWKYITAPADGDSVFTIGAVDLNSESTFFSSFGPSYDGRTKPNVSALGLDVIAVNDEGILRNIAGTSFSCPIIAGMTACLWQAFPDRNNMEILKAIEMSAHLYHAPEDQMGFGIPNFELAYKILESNIQSDKEFLLFPNPVKDILQIWFFKPKSSIYSYTIADANGNIVFAEQEAITPFENKIDCSNLARGTYYLLIEFGKTKIKEKFLKL